MAVLRCYEAEMVRCGLPSPDPHHLGAAMYWVGLSAHRAEMAPGRANIRGEVR